MEREEKLKALDAAIAKLEKEYGIKLPETWETDKYGNKIEKVEDIYHIYDDGTQET